MLLWTAFTKVLPVLEKKGIVLNKFVLNLFCENTIGATA
jgi:hypothetical protein